jgi:hypothetical protein
MIFLIPQNSYKSFNTKLFDQHDIKMHYINMCDKIDSFSIVQHGFLLIQL